MTNISPNLSLPYLMPAQAQKHVTHNEALQRLDILVQLRVQAFGATQPPTDPEEGTVFATGAGAAGDWSGQEDMLAAYSNGGWEYFTPRDGWRATLVATGAQYVRTAGTWAAVAPDMDNLEGVGIGAAADATNRLSVTAEATLLSHEGAGHQLKINKATAADTGSLLFQTGFFGRAEMGLAGDDNFTVKVSADGSAWTTAMRVDAANGAVTTQKMAFTAGRNLNQTGIANKLHTPLLFDVAPRNPAGMIDLQTGRLTPPEGAVSAIAGTYVTGLTPGGICSLGIWKNGVLFVQKVYYAQVSGDIGMDVALHDLCSGSDYYQVMLYVSTGATATANNNQANTYWRGFHH